MLHLLMWWKKFQISQVCKQHNLILLNKPLTYSHATNRNPPKQKKLISFIAIMFVSQIALVYYVYFSGNII